MSNRTAADQSPTDYAVAKSFVDELDVLVDTLTDAPFDAEAAQKLVQHLVANQPAAIAAHHRLEAIAARRAV